MTIDIDEVKVARGGAGLWLGWALATAAGMALGFVPPLLLAPEVDLWLFRMLVPLWAGLLVGLFQWAVLRGYLTHAADWIVNGSGGWALGFSLGLLVIHLLSGSLIGTILSYLLFGVIVGVIQWPVLRREIPSAFPWVLASVLGWSLGALTAQLILMFIAAGSAPSPIISTLVSVVITGLVAGAVTGLALIWITRQPEVPV